MLSQGFHSCVPTEKAGGSLLRDTGFGDAQNSKMSYSPKKED